ncbi:hypothetical protein H206_05173 [Candidatus Electrothrix aarhusensis]|uniref:Uncharacterized protein n=1 Tax=Candidatus Electrothrix aarhusensis TaxID=1859131 RepID=A0A3S3SR92_9BACT|nr:hypothetical protein H206_05173 [Candidatus Electrothrix aarhusensis]
MSCIIQGLCSTSMYPPRRAKYQIKATQQAHQNRTEERSASIFARQISD